MPAVGSVSVKATTAVAVDRREHEALALLRASRTGRPTRQTPLATWTIIRSDACDMEKSSSSSSQRENGIPRPPYSSGAASER